MIMKWQKFNTCMYIKKLCKTKINVHTETKESSGKLNGFSLDE